MSGTRKDWMLKFNKPEKVSTLLLILLAVMGLWLCIVGCFQAASV